MPLRWIQLPPDERNEFLGTGGTGVIAFSTEREEPPFSLPISYGYLEDNETFYFRLAFLDESNKRTYVDRPVSFVTHERSDRVWRSVIATGRLEALEDAPYDSIAVQGMWGVDIPTIDIFDRPRNEVTFHDFRLVPERLSGRKAIPLDE